MATPPDFTTGQVLTAAQMNAVGLWLIKEQTIGSAVATVELTDVFSADYDNYLIQIAGGATSASAYLDMRFGATTTGYSWSALYAANFNTASGNVVYLSSNAGTHVQYVGYGSANGISANITVIGPNLAKRTTISADLFAHQDNAAIGKTIGLVPNNTQYTSFIIDPNGAATMTGGVVRVYGYRSN